MSAYCSTMMEIGASTKCTIPFESEGDMIAIMNGILAKRKVRYDVTRVLDKVRHGGYYFFDLDLTREEAESLGWNSANGD
jgi:hypothetical protein